MDLHPDEPAASWERVHDVVLRERLLSLLGGSGAGLVLVDGRSGAGKTTCATKVAGLLGAALVHTDDMAWNHGFFDWDDLLLDHVVTPWRRGEPVAYVPPGWAAHGRAGAVEVPVAATLVVEGVGAARESLAGAAQVRIWVQSDRAAARRLGLARDVDLGREPAEADEFWDEWMSAEEPFQARSRPWARADLVLRGATDAAAEPDWSYVSPGPLRADAR